MYSFPCEIKRLSGVCDEFSMWFKYIRKIELIKRKKVIKALLSKRYHDYVMIRRYLVDYGFLDRKADGSAYWLKGS